MSADTIVTIVALVVTLSVLGAYFYLKKKREEQRLLTLFDSLDSLGLTYSEDVASALEGLSELPMLQRAKGSGAENLLCGSFEGVSVEIFDFRYRTTKSRTEHYEPHEQTVLKLRSPQLHLPVFELRPEGMFDKIECALGYNDVDFDLYPEFSARYLLRGPDEEAIREAFRPKLLKYLESTFGLIVEGTGDTLITYQVNRKAAVEELQPMIDHGLALIRAFAAYSAPP